MDNSIIIVLGMILLILIMLNHLNIVIDHNQQKPPLHSSCTQTSFGCCPDGVNSKINFYGTNCPGYKPPQPPQQPQPKKH